LNVKVGMRKCSRKIYKNVLDTMSDLVGKVDKRARKPWITQEMINKMDERKKWKNVNTEEGRRNYRRLRNELKGATEKAKKEYLENACTEIMGFHRKGRYDLMYMTKELGWKETQGIQNIGIEDSQGNRIVDQKKVLKIWENYVTELYDRPNRPETLEAEPEEVDTDEKGPYILKSDVEKAVNPSAWSDGRCSHSENTSWSDEHRLPRAGSHSFGNISTTKTATVIGLL